MALLLSLMAVLAVSVASLAGLNVSGLFSDARRSVENSIAAAPVHEAPVRRSAPAGGSGDGGDDPSSGDEPAEDPEEGAQDPPEDAGESDPDPQPHPSPDPCLFVGDVCADGTVLAGSQDGTPVYTTPDDAAAGLPWNDGSNSWSRTGVFDLHDGAANTARLVGATGDGGMTGARDYPFKAARLCARLNAHGYDDWFLPAKAQLDLLRDAYLDGALGEIEDGGIYWSSTEQNGKSRACVTRFAPGQGGPPGGKAKGGPGGGKGAARCLGGGYRGNADERKNDTWRVRCVRTG